MAWNTRKNRRKRRQRDSFIGFDGGHWWKYRCTVCGQVEERNYRSIYGLPPTTYGSVCHLAHCVPLFLGDVEITIEERGDWFVPSLSIPAVSTDHV
jgi:hypothetical protein